MASSGLEALPLLGSACDERDGAHLAEDLAIVEVIDRRTGRACGARRARQPGRHGAREGQLPPALRPARTSCGSTTTPCPCGETHRRLFYEGRVRDIVAGRRARGAADRRRARALRVPRGVDAVGRVPDRAAGGAGAGAARALRARRRASTRAALARRDRRALPRAARRRGAASSWCRRAGCRASPTRRRASSTPEEGGRHGDRGERHRPSLRRGVATSRARSRSTTR